MKEGFKPPTRVLIEECLKTNPKASAMDISKYVCLKQKRSVVLLSGTLVKEIRDRMGIAPKINRAYRRIDYGALENLFAKSPDISYKEVNKIIPLSFNSYMNTKRRLFGSSRKKKNDRLYFKICSFSTERLSADAKSVLKEFVGVLNASGRVSFEIIELMDPPQLEIREAKR